MITFEQINNFLVLAGIGAIAFLIYFFLEYITAKVARRKRTNGAG